MKFSELYAPTLKESPAEAEVISHKLLLRAGMIRKVATGVYTFMPLGYKVIRKIEKIIREEMDRVGGQEILMPVIQPADVWKQTGRWDQYGPEMMRLKDRHGREFALGPTHEELVTTLVKDELRSYKQLPLTLYQIQVKFRDEIRPRFGLMRAREFIMKDAYSFNADIEQLQKSYSDMYDAYTRIFTRCGLNFRAIEAATGLIGGKVSQEFTVLAESGETTVLYCERCDYAASDEIATTRLPEPSDEEIKPSETVSTPGVKSVAEVSAFLGVPETKIVKTLIYKFGARELAAVLIRGDRDVNEEKLSAVLGTNDFHLLAGMEWEEYPELIQGYVGPVGLKDVRIIADNEISVMRNFVVGANKKDAHIVNVNVGEDFQVKEWAEVKLVKAGDQCPECEGKLLETRGIEVGQIFQLGAKYSSVLGAVFVDEDGQTKPYIMGTYGIGVSRTAAAAIEQHNDENGIIWPISIAPYEVSIIVLNYDKDEQREIGDKIYRGLEEKGVEVIIDDRVESAGKKFADSDLIGFPLQVIIGGRTIKSGNVEVKKRETNERVEFPLEQAVDEIAELVKEMHKSLQPEE
ncbi:MAG: proline--tRNA ligase [Firmicutes bacterium]|nr:proline--tRNA ligase [Bacillota bacterium]